MKPWVSHHHVLKEILKDPAMAAGYITTALEEGDWDAFLLALRQVAEVHGGLATLAKKSKLHRVHLYRMLSKQGNPGMRNILNLLRALGFKVTIQPPAKLPRAA